MKNIFKSFSVSVRRFLAQYCKSVFRCYYKHLWKPAPGSLAARIDAFSKSRQKIRFIQVGSNDGIQHDPLHKFIIRDRWSGILTEPQPEAYQLLKKLYRGMDIVPLNAAVDSHVTGRILYRISFTRQRWASGLSSFNRSQIEKVIDSGYVDERCKKEGIIPPADKADYIEEIQVPCMSFTEIAGSWLFEDGIDLLHIDTEGYDYEILKQFDFVRNQPGMVIFEHSHLSSDDYSAAVTMLQSFGYTTTRLSSDTVAMK